MKSGKHVLSWDSALLQSMVFYIALAVVLLPHYQYQINPDGVSYISIAQKYMHQAYRDAINAYWGPLLSWLLLPVLIVGVKPLLAAKLLSLAIGAVTVVQSNTLIKTLGIEGALGRVILFLIAAITASWALVVITPDLLFVCLALCYINTILDASYAERKYSGVLCGTLGAALYLTKSYGFVFFIVHFCLVNVLLYLRASGQRDRGRIARNAIFGIAAFAVLACCWAAVLSSKYGHVTIGTAGRYNHAVMRLYSPEHPMHYAGLFDPPNGTATSIWEDASYLNVRDWSMFDSRSAFEHQLAITRKNIVKIISFLHGFSYLSLASLVAAAVYVARKRRRIVADSVFYLVLSVIVLCLGYAVVLVESRYLWLCDLLIVIMGARMLALWFTSRSIHAGVRAALIAVFAVSFAVTPLVELYHFHDAGEDVRALSDTIDDLNIQGRIASNGNWGWSLYLAFFNGWQYSRRKGGARRGERSLACSTREQEG